MMTCDVNNLSSRKQPVDFQFALITIQAVEEFDCRVLCRSPDRSILAHARAQFVDAQSTVTSEES